MPVDEDVHDDLDGARRARRAFAPEPSGLSRVAAFPAGSTPPPTLDALEAGPSGRRAAGSGSGRSSSRRPHASLGAAHLQRGALALSAEQILERKVENVFRVIAQALYVSATQNFLSLPAPALTIRGGGRQSRRTLYGQEMNEAKDVFTLIDKDGNGSLDYPEFREALNRLDLALSEDQVEEVLKATDADKNGTIEVAEFIAKLETEWDVAGPVRTTPQNSSYKKL